MAISGVNNSLYGYNPYATNAFQASPLSDKITRDDSSSGGGTSSGNGTSSGGSTGSGGGTSSGGGTGSGGNTGSGGSTGSGGGTSSGGGTGSGGNTGSGGIVDPFPDKPTSGNKNELDNEAFMRLFLEQLKNQDPTAPMETQDILTQTAQLTQVESQTKMKEAMEEMTSAMKSMQETNEKTIEAQNKLIETQQKMLETMGILAGSIQDSSIIGGYNTVGMIGNIAETPFTALKVEKNEEIEFELYFDEPIDPTKGSPKITITDKDNNVIKEIDLAAKDEEGNYIYAGKSGYVEFKWDTTNSSGAYVGNGDYNVRAEYNLDDKTNKYKETQLGRGEVQSILFEGGVPYVKLGDKLTVPIIYVTSYYKKTGEGVDLPDLPKPDESGGGTGSGGDSSTDKKRRIV
ncbi:MULTISPECIES: flagellar hook assembly protein FlgD [Helicobacter]|uniref:Basal-body rod modification protein FlgD n=1 Tax=Helicobacter ibis TaxID=2962633 RepID=A0ABT4VDE0_9HELI|nr:MULTISPECIES: flagellar hook assembly protein FlgD [Helicobacter]MDA3967817.1 flagellar hook assembly protein FlgD [Helicobacter sp. WB40]MDA3968719.1 flagellar hook assembly protein FlgD [Helicobacter ibis]